MIFTHNDIAHSLIKLAMLILILILLPEKTEAIESSSIQTTENQTSSFNERLKNTQANISQTNNSVNYQIAANILEILAALIAIIVTFKKPRNAMVSYSRRIFKDDHEPYRKTPQKPTSTPPIKIKQKTWKLLGCDKTTSEELTLILTEKELIKGVIIGRNTQYCDYSIPEKKLSRQHVKLSNHQNGILVQDLNSANGTYINNQRVKPDSPQLLTLGNTLNLSKVIVFTLS